MTRPDVLSCKYTQRKDYPTAVFTVWQTSSSQHSFYCDTTKVCGVLLNSIEWIFVWPPPSGSTQALPGKKQGKWASNLTPIRWKQKLQSCTRTRGMAMESKDVLLCKWEHSTSPQYSITFCKQPQLSAHTGLVILRTRHIY